MSADATVTPAPDGPVTDAPAGGNPFRATDRRSRLMSVGLTTGLVLVTGAIWLSPELPGPAGRIGRAVVEAVPGVGDRAEADPAEQLRVQLAATRAELARLRREQDAVPAAGPTAPAVVPAVVPPAVRLPGTTAVPRPARMTPRPAGTSPTTRPSKPSGRPTPTPTTPTTRPTPRPTTPVQRPATCDDFRWQQDAQAALAADPALAPRLDPNGDGYACRGYLAVDARRPATPLPAEPLPPAPATPQIVAAAQRYLGVYTPTRVGEADEVTATTGTAPTVWGWFGGWGTWTTAEDGTRSFAPEAYDAAKVTAAWKRGVLPMLTWEPRPIVSPAGAYYQDFTLAKIVDGEYDAYITEYAASVKRLGLPLAIRFAHEMNGSWYPWAEQTNGNAPGQFVQAWRHVHDLFEAAGAGDLVVWVWAPNRIDNLPAAGRDLARYYPGDDYVDWVGMSAYLRPTASPTAATFDGTFGRTLTALRATAPGKPVVLAEIGATETLVDAEGRSVKPAWVRSVFDALADPANDDVVGVVWFDMAKTALVDGVPQTNDWRIGSTPEALDAFRDGLQTDGLDLAAPYAG